MRPWIIVLSSATIALAAAAAMAWPTLSLTPAAAVVPALMPRLPTLVVTALAVYALSAIVLVAVNLIGGGLKLRRQLTRGAAHHGPAGSDWTAAFERSGLQRLAPVPAFPQPRSAKAGGILVLQERFHRGEACREVARVFYIWAARTHFFSALIALAGSVALGAAQQHGPLPIIPGPIPTVPAGLILVGLLLLALLARLAIDVTIDPLIEMISGFPTERIDVALFRRAVEVLEDAPARRQERGDEASAVLQVPDRLVGALEEGHRVLSDAVERLSATNDGLAATTRSSIEALESTFRAAEQRQPPAPAASADLAELAQLREAMVALTAALERVPTGPAAGEDTVSGVNRAVRHSEAPQSDLADQLKQLLQEIETTP